MTIKAFFHAVPPSFNLTPEASNASPPNHGLLTFSSLPQRAALLEVILISSEAQQIDKGQAASHPWSSPHAGADRPLQAICSGRAWEWESSQSGGRPMHCTPRGPGRVRPCLGVHGSPTCPAMMHLLKMQQHNPIPYALAETKLGVLSAPLDMADL